MFIPCVFACSRSSAARIPSTTQTSKSPSSSTATTPRAHVPTPRTQRQVCPTPCRAPDPPPLPRPQKLSNPQPQFASSLSLLNTSFQSLSVGKKSRGGSEFVGSGEEEMLRAGGRRLVAPGLRRLLGEGAPAAAAPVWARGYHERVVDHYNNPRNVGSFDKDDPNVGTGLVGAPACGDVMKLQIRVDEGSGKIVDACFKTFGCGSAIASSSVATEWVKGKQMEEVVTIKNTEIAKHLSLPPVKLHCSMLAEDAIKAAVKDYEAKKAKLGEKSEDRPAEKAAEA